MPDLFYYFVLFLLGLSAGSFLNVLSLRYSPARSVFSHRSLGGRSQCLHCGRPLTFVELIPILSFFIQRGRCRSCGARLTVQYPIVEFLSGLIFVAVPLYLHNFYGILNPFSFDASLRTYYGLLVAWLLAFLVWLLMSVIDIRHYLVPNELNIGLFFLGAIVTAVKSFPSAWFSPFHGSFLRHYELLFSPFQTVWLNHLFGAGVALVFFGLLVVLSRGRAMGMGDVKLAFASGLILGWPDIGLAIVLAFVLGGLLGALLLAFRKKTLHDKIPFAPLFILGVLITFFFGFQLTRDYFTLFNI